MTPDFKPPTDNLYKFLAVFGLALIVLGAWGVIQIFNKRVEMNLEEAVTRELIRRGIPTSEFWPMPEERHDVDGKLKAAEIKRSVEFPRDLTLVTGSVALFFFGMFISLAGFALWLFRVQIPVDQILWAEYRESCKSDFREDGQHKWLIYR